MADHSNSILPPNILMFDGNEKDYFGKDSDVTDSEHLLVHSLSPTVIILNNGKIISIGTGDSMTQALSGALMGAGPFLADKSLIIMLNGCVDNEVFSNLENFIHENEVESCIIIAPEFLFNDKSIEKIDNKYKFLISDILKIKMKTSAIYAVDPTKLKCRSERDPDDEEIINIKFGLWILKVLKSSKPQFIFVNNFSTCGIFREEDELDITKVERCVNGNNNPVILVSTKLLNRPDIEILNEIPTTAIVQPPVKKCDMYSDHVIKRANSDNMTLLYYKKSF